MEKQFELHRVGYHIVHEHGVNIDRPNGSGDYLFLYLKSNVTVYTVDGEVTVREPSFILLEEGFPQRYYENPGPFINDWMHFGGNDLKHFFEKLDIPLNKLMVLQNAKEISTMVQDLRSESRQQGRYHEEILDHKIQAMFYKFSDIYHEEIKFSDKLNRYRRDFNEVRNRIYNFQLEKHETKVSDIATSLNLSTSYFQHIYKQLFGVSVVSDMIKSRIEYACYLLSNSADSVAEVAFQCGYENKEHFTRQFKEVTGYTPRQYREKH